MTTALSQTDVSVLEQDALVKRLYTANITLTTLSQLYFDRGSTGLSYMLKEAGVPLSARQNMMELLIESLGERTRDAALQSITGEDLTPLSIAATNTSLPPRDVQDSPAADNLVGRGGASESLLKRTFQHVALPLETKKPSAGEMET